MSISQWLLSLSSTKCCLFFSHNNFLTAFLLNSTFKSSKLARAQSMLHYIKLTYPFLAQWKLLLPRCLILGSFDTDKNIYIRPSFHMISSFLVNSRAYGYYRVYMAILKCQNNGNVTAQLSFFLFISGITFYHNREEKKSSIWCKLIWGT